MATNQPRGVTETLRMATLAQEFAGLTDAQLLERYIQGREEAVFVALLRRHGPMVWGVYRRVLRSHQDAEDAFQATFLVLVRKAAVIERRPHSGKGGRERQLAALIAVTSATNVCGLAGHLFDAMSARE